MFPEKTQFWQQMHTHDVHPLLLFWHMCTLCKLIWASKSGRSCTEIEPLHKVDRQVYNRSASVPNTLALKTHIGVPWNIPRTQLIQKVIIIPSKQICIDVPLDLDSKSMKPHQKEMFCTVGEDIQWIIRYPLSQNYLKTNILYIFTLGDLFLVNTNRPVNPKLNK